MTQPAKIDSKPDTRTADTAADSSRSLVRKAREARLHSQIDSCKALEKQAFRLAELARESDLQFLVYLFDMARVAAVDERNRLTRQVSLAGGRG
ncbi:MAG: hypothetical protein ACRCXM_08370 [Beijerinckiaceae bacterium]